MEQLIDRICKSLSLIVGACLLMVAITTNRKAENSAYRTMRNSAINHEYFRELSDDQIIAIQIGEMPYQEMHKLVRGMDERRRIISRNTTQYSQ
jgi:hypothetical protein